MSGWWGLFQTTYSQSMWARQGEFFFTVRPDFTLVHAASTSLLASQTWHRIRVVGAKGKFHGVDPKIEVDEFDLWTLWIREGRPLS